MATSLIGLGTNLGDRAANLTAAVKLLSELPETSVLSASSIHASRAAVGGAEQDEFLNRAVVLETALAPPQLLLALQEIEGRLGRNAGQDRWAAREIDLDLLIYDDLVLSEPTLEVPHRRMAFRRFVLGPAAEIAPDFVHPTTEFTLAELLARLDMLPRRIAITGVSTLQTKRLARQAAAKSSARLIEDPQIAELSDRRDALVASPTCQTAIEFVYQRRDYLRSVRSDPAIPSPQTEVTGSWIGECNFLAKLLLMPDALLEFERTWKNDRDAHELDRTTLIVVLFAPGETHLAPLSRKIKQLATTPRQSPWLLLDPNDSDWALTEVVAAIESMQ